MGNFLHHLRPGQRPVLTALISDLGLRTHFAVVHANGHPAVEVVGVARREIPVRLDFDPPSRADTGLIAALGSPSAAGLSPIIAPVGERYFPLLGR